MKSPTNIPEFSVAEIAQLVKRTIESNFERVRVRGEISGLTRPASGHLYCKLKDTDAVLDAVVWKFSLPKLGLVPTDGMEVIATGKLTTYPNGSRYQIVVEKLALAGAGALLKLLEERKKKLAAEGMFDAARKRPLPYLPRSIGIITSPTGAVIRDILHRLADRCPARVLLWPTTVQGDGTAQQIIAAIQGFADFPQNGLPRPEVIIIARGGGSIEDLWEFNDEALVRAVVASPIPIISAIGHETDFTLIDFAADMRAPTPTAAAEMAVPVRSQLLARLGEQQARLRVNLLRQLTIRRQILTGLQRGLRHPRDILNLRMQKTDELVARLNHAMQKMILRRRNQLQKISLQPQLLARDILRQREKTQKWADRMTRAWQGYARQNQEKLGRCSQLLRSLSYERVLERGFALVLDGQDNAITGIRQLQKDQKVKIRLRDGQKNAVIE